MKTAKPSSGSTASPRYVSASEVRGLLPPAAAVQALAQGFLARDQDTLNGVPRSVVPIPGPDSDPAGELLLMPAHGPEGAGLKLVSIVRENPSHGLPLIQGLYVLLAAGSLTPELLIDGAALTGVRTAAVSALATAHLARASSRHLVVFGAGAQGRSHVEAMRAILPIDRVTVVGGSMQSPRATSLAGALLADGLEACVGDRTAIRTADVICTCTTSTAVVFDDSDVKDGTHINAVGAYRLDMREIPAETLERALLVVESIEATLEEAGDVVAAIRTGELPEVRFAHELGAVLSGHVARADDRQVTVFKSVGLSAEDLILARALADALDARTPSATEPYGATTPLHRREHGSTRASDGRPR